MSKKSEMILGYTRTGIEVFLPTRSTFDVGKCAGWSRGDHVDASHILAEHSDRERDSEVGSWCKRWAKAHREIGKSSRAGVIRSAAETSILSRRRKR